MIDQIKPSSYAMRLVDIEDATTIVAAWSAAFNCLGASGMSLGNDAVAVMAEAMSEAVIRLSETIAAAKREFM